MSKDTPHTHGVHDDGPAPVRGRHLWRSLDHLADTPDFRSFLEREFPRGAAEMADPVSRRAFLKLMGASLGLAGLSGCTFDLRPPQEKVAPYARGPLNQTPGIPNFYATAASHDGYALGVVAKSYDGRPIKLEGNPNHPASLGATDAFTQAEVLNLYDPDRVESALNKGAISTWNEFQQALGASLQVQRALQGAGLRILTGTVTSPTFAAQMKALLETFPSARWVQWSPVGQHNTRAGSQLAFGEYVETRYRFDQARVVLALDSNFMFDGPAHVRYSRDFSTSRRVRAASQDVSRLYVVEPELSITGAVADHRQPARASAVESYARAVALGVGVATAGPQGEVDKAFVDAALADLNAHRGRAIVIVGEGQPPVVHALGHAINQALGNVGQTVEYSDPVVASPSDQLADMRTLADDMRNGRVNTLVMFGGNPAYNAPADLDFIGALAAVPFKAYLGFYRDETAALADWYVPETHFLESWGDLRAFDGTTTIVQPLILPLYQGHSAYELLGIMLGQVGTDYDTVRAYWKTAQGEAGFDAFWAKSLNDGLVAGSALAARVPTFQANALAAQPTPLDTASLELIFRPDPTVFDGRYANNGWLQELPKPITKLTWDNAATVSPRTAAKILGLNLSDDQLFITQSDEGLGRENGRVVTLSVGGRSVNAPLWIVPGQADDTVVVTLGYGRTTAGRVGQGIGFNAYSLRGSDMPWIASGLQVTPTAGHYKLVSTQDHWSMEGRDIVRVKSLAEFKALLGGATGHEPAAGGEHGAAAGEHGPQSILPGGHPQADNAWGMTIDLQACIGCNACTMACQAENNIPVVGKDQVAVGREMHWMRIDRYFGGELANPDTYFMPMFCQQCEQAPCELVCPVAATVHDNEGLNNMVYNRCVGTKYCSNNCPYKVRRFNFLQYQDNDTIQLKLMRNPDVTVRNRGVMEKCTFCVQRISLARIAAKRSGNRPIADGEIVTACQQVCPTQAISFGDLKNTQSQVAQLKHEPHNYTLLDELNTYPRASYLARIHNPNEALASEAEEKSS